MARARPNPEKNNFSSHILEAIHIFTDEWFEFELPRILAVQFKSSDDCDEIRKKFDGYAHNYEIFLQNMPYTLRSVDDYCVDMAIAEELRRPYWSEYHHKKFQNFVESNIGNEEIWLPRAWKFFLGKLKK